MRIWRGAAAAIFLFATACGDLESPPLIVEDSHVVRDGPTGDVDVAWRNMSGVAVWTALDKRELEMVRIRNDGAPLATFQDFPGQITETTKVRLAATKHGFTLIAGQPETQGVIATLTPDTFVVAQTSLPRAKAFALAPPIIALVEPMEGALLLGDIDNDSPRTPMLVKDGPKDLIGIGAAFGTKLGVVVTVDRHGCVEVISVDELAKPTGHLSRTSCVDGNWQSATAAAWPTASGSNAEAFAVAVGFTGIIDGAADATKGFAIDLELGKKGQVSILRAAPAPFKPVGNAFYGKGEAGIQLNRASGGVLAARFDDDGHPLDAGDAVVWDASEAGTVRALTGVTETTWIAVAAGSSGASSRILARAISLQ